MLLDHPGFVGARAAVDVAFDVAVTEVCETVGTGSFGWTRHAG